MNRIGIEFITVFGMPPVDFVNLAADLGCAHIGIALAPMLSNPHNYPAWTLRDAGLRRQTVAALRDRGVSISVGEGFMVRQGADLRDSQADLDAMCDLGVKRVNVISIDADRSRTFDQIGTFVGMAEAAGLETTVEFAPMMVGVPDLAAAVAAVKHVGRPSFKVMIDTLHLARCGAGPKDVAALDPKVIGYIQLCDGPKAFTTQSYMDESRFERMVPGEGEFPLLEVLKALPRDLVVGLEVPQQRDALAGMAPKQAVGRCVEAARRMLAKLDG